VLSRLSLWVGGCPPTAAAGARRSSRPREFSATARHRCVPGLSLGAHPGRRAAHAHSLDLARVRTSVRAWLGMPRQARDQSWLQRSAPSTIRRTAAREIYSPLPQRKSAQLDELQRQRVVTRHRSPLSAARSTFSDPAICRRTVRKMGGVISRRRPASSQQPLVGCGLGDVHRELR